MGQHDSPKPLYNTSKKAKTGKNDKKNIKKVPVVVPAPVDAVFMLVAPGVIPVPSDLLSPPAPLPEISRPAPQKPRALGPAERARTHVLFCMEPGCTFSTSTKWCLTRHAHLHLPSDERPHVCEDCGVGARTAEALGWHRNKRHGAPSPTRPYPVKCVLCTHVSPSSAGNTAHMKEAHPEKIPCPYKCGVPPFRHEPSLARHVRQTCPNAPLEKQKRDIHHCPVTGCGVKARQAYNVTVHLRRKHPDFSV